MLSFFRTMAKSKLVWIVLFVPMMAGLLTIGGVRQDLSGLFTPKDAVIQAGSRTYTTNDFKREFEAYRKRAAQEGQTFTADDAVAQGLDQRMLQVFSERESMGDTLKRLGVWPSDKQVVGEIAKVKAFQDPISGKFDQKAYVQLLAQNDATPAQFEKDQRDQLAYTQFGAAVASGLKPPRLFGAMFGAYLYETRDLSLFGIKPDVLGKPATPTDAELQKIIKDHADQLTVPETRQLSVVRFSAAALAPTLTADPAEVKKRFDFRKDTLSQPEKRSLIQISAKDAAQALDVSTKLKAGGDPAAVAKAAGLQQPLVYTDVPKSGVADSKVGEAAFQLPAGGVSNPIQGNLGWAVIKVAQVTPAKIVTFEEAKPSIEAEVKSEAAANKAYELVQKYEAAHDKGSNLTESAKVAGVMPQTFAPATASGMDADGAPIPGLTPRMLKEAAALAQGGESDAVQDSKGEYFALRVEKVIPPTLPSLDKIRPRLVQLFQQQDISKRLTDKLAELQARVKKGEAFEAVAKSIGSDVVHLKINRNQALQNRNIPPALLSQIFSGKPGDLVVTGSGLGRIDAIEPVPPGVIASSLQPGQQTLGRSVFDEIQQESRTWAREQTKPKINLAIARQAIGATDKAVPAAASGAAPAPPAGKAQ
jgi:peptidyl-prolyl cis-trans isomerase D